MSIDKLHDEIDLMAKKVKDMLERELEALKIQVNEKQAELDLVNAKIEDNNIKYGCIHYPISIT